MFLGGQFKITFGGYKTIGANSYATFDVCDYGLIFIFEDGTQGAFAIFGVVGDVLTLIATSHYAVGEGGLFPISKTSGVLKITNTLDRFTKHGVLSFG